MSDVLSHAYCAYKAIKKNENPLIRKMISRHEDIYLIGAQGPDIFFYYRVWPWLDSQNIPKIGSRLHEEATFDFFLHSANYIKQLKNHDVQERLIVYLMGFLSHYALDQLSHPFIFYYSGVYNSADPDTYAFQYEHKLFECSLDTLLAKDDNEFTKKYQTQAQIIPSGIQLPTEFDCLFEEVIKSIYNIGLTPSSPSESVKSMHQVLRLMNSPLIGKHRCLVTIETLLNKPLAYSTAVFPSKIKPKVDYLNLKHNIWYHPCDTNKNYKLSYRDIIDSAVLLTVKYIHGLYNYMENEIDKEALHKIIPNNNYNTGLSINSSQNMKYYASIYR